MTGKKRPPAKSHSSRKTRRKDPARTGKPFWVQWGTLFPSTEAVAMGRAVLPGAMAIIDRQKNLAGQQPGEWLEQDLVRIADGFCRGQAYRNLPPSQFYRNAISGIKEAAQELRKLIDETPDKALWDLQRNTRQVLGLDLKRKPEHALRPAVSALAVEIFLAQFIAVCEKCSEIEGVREDDRPDITAAVSDLANLWTQLSGGPFRKSVALIKNVEGLADPNIPEFKSPGARFVYEMLHVFDPTIGIAQVATAIKKIRVKSRISQKSPPKGRRKAE